VLFRSPGPTPAPVADRGDDGAAALVGQRGTVVTAIGDGRGQVRIGGEVWSARSYADDDHLAVGTPVDIVGIDGATAVVLAREPHPFDQGEP